MKIEQLNKRFHELVTEEVHLLRDTFTQEQKDRLRADVLNWGYKCVYQQVFGSFFDEKAMELKNFTKNKANIELKANFDSMGVMEYYLAECEQTLPKEQWHEVRSRVVDTIKGDTTEPLIPLDLQTASIYKDFGVDIV